MDNQMKRLKESLEAASEAYRAVAIDEMDKGINGSPDTVYDCVRHSRNLRTRVCRLERFNSVY